LKTIPLLRSIGILNAAVWFGAALFFTFVGGPAIFSSDMRNLLGHNFPFFSGAIFEVLARRYFQLQVVCAIIALAHLAAEWLYLAKYPQKLSLALVLCLCLTCGVGGWWFQPKLHRLHALRYGLSTPSAPRLAAEHAFPAWQTGAHLVNFLTVAGLAVYLWRVANPPDPTRFVSAAKFRS
jgi:hypothetical protein